MNLKIIGSGSSGNSYLLESPTGTLILDAGVKFKEIQKALNFDFSKVVACLVTHEHGDHSKVVKDVLKAGIDTYMTNGTMEALGITHHRLWTVQLSWPGYQFNIRDFTILPFATEHDAIEPCGYLIYYQPTGEKICFATDTYFIRNRFNALNYILCECNYCKDTLDANIEAGFIPQAMKNRLLESHFSLEHVKEFLKANDLSQVRTIVLLHLSGSNSDAERMIREITELTGKEVVVANSGMEIPLQLCPF